MKTPTWESSPGALIAHLNAITKPMMADLYTITLTNGTVYRNTNCDVALVVNGNTFGIGPRIERSAIKQSVGIAVDTLTLDVYAGDDVTLGGIPLVQAFALGLLDGASILLERAFLSDPATVVGTLFRFFGRVGQVKTERGHANVEVRSHTELLDVMIPTGVYQPSCRNTLYDLNCGVARAALAVTKTVAVGTTSSRLTFQFVTGAVAADYMTLGVVKCTIGANAGVSRTIKRQTASGSNSIIEVIQPWPFAMGVGDTIVMVPGCDKLQATCSGKFSNLVHFAAEPYVPLPDMIV